MVVGRGRWITGRAAGTGIGGGGVMVTEKATTGDAAALNKGYDGGLTITATTFQLRLAVVDLVAQDSGESTNEA